MSTNVPQSIALDVRPPAVAMPPMVWSVVLAAGDGTRLSTLTQDDAGNQVPKQFCSLTGGHTLLHDALQRARRVSPANRTCVIVAKKHRQHWSGILSNVDADNIIVQPRNCGTAIGILLATLHITRRDPFARIVFLPADHYVHDEALLGASMRETAALVFGLDNEIALLGIEPEGIDCDLGYIVPGPDLQGGARSVSRFVEKPDVSHAESLLGSGAVWNSFIFASTAQTIVKVMRQHVPHVVDAMCSILTSSTQQDVAAGMLHDLYQNLLPVDFSRQVLQQAHGVLRLVTAPACGWTDLGTPKRVAKVLRDQHDLLSVVRPRQEAATGVLSLAMQCRRLGLSV